MSAANLASRHPTATRPVSAPLLAGSLLLAGCVTLAIVDPSHGPTLCPFKVVTGLDCPGCGGTRAAHQLFTGHLGAALSYNVLAVIALPLIVWGAFVSLTAMLGGPRWRSISVSGRWTWLAFGVVATFWVIRNLPLAPFNWLGTGT